MGSVPAYSATTVGGGVTSPLANAILCSVAPGPGAFACSYLAYYTGTIGIIDTDNIALQSDPVTAGTYVTADVLLQQPITNAPLVINHYLVFAMSTVRLIVVANSTSGSVYHAQLNVVYPGPSGSFL